jgi:hypothetical protein
VLLSAYLSLTLLLDAAQVRTLFLSSASQSESHYSNVFCSAVAVKAVVLILESKQKTSWINWNEKDHSPEDQRHLFSWDLLLAKQHFLVGIQESSLYQRSVSAR